MSPSVPAYPAPAKTKTALVIDDFPSVRHYHSFILQKAGFVCRGAQNGTEALELLKQQPVDLVVLDLVMPDMGGEELLAHLRASATWAQLPVLIITSESIGERIRRERTPTAGPVGFVRKPLLPAAILAEVGRLMR